MVPLYKQLVYEGGHPCLHIPVYILFVIKMHHIDCLVNPLVADAAMVVTLSDVVYGSFS